MSKTYSETVNLSRLLHIIEHADKYNLGKSYVHGALVDGAAQLTLFREYAGLAKKFEGANLGEAQVLMSYHQADWGGGRQYASGKIALANLSRPVRHTICRGILRDIDMVNAHPRFLEWFCKTNGVPCEHLSAYIRNRDQFLRTVQESMGVDRDKAKQLFLKATNREESPHWPANTPLILRDYSAQMESIASRAQEIRPDLVEITKKSLAKTKKEEWNIGGKVMNKIMGEIENRCLTIIESRCEAHGKEVASLVYDGLMIKDRTTDDLSALLRDCEDTIRERVGVDLEIKEKIMDEGVEVPEDLPQLPWEAKLAAKQEKQRQRQQEEEREKQSKEAAKQEKIRAKEIEEENMRKAKERSKENARELKKQRRHQMEEEDEEEYREMKESFDRTHMKILENTQFVSLTKEGMVTMCRRTIMDAYEHLRYGDRKPFIKRWLEDPEIPMRRRFDTIPHTLPCPEDVYNLWKPFTCEETYDYERSERVEQGVQFIRDHIKGLAGDDDAVFDYIEKWTAALLFYPQHKNRMLTFTSSQGAGKGSFVMVLEKMIGRDHVFATSMPSRDVWGQFNDRMGGNTYLVVLEEIGQKEQYGALDYIKTLVEHPKLTINPKGKPGYDITSYHKFIALSNHDEPVKTSADDRRNFIVRCSDKFIGNVEHFNRLHALLNDRDVIWALYDHYRRYKPEEVAVVHTLPSSELPITEYQHELCELSFCPVRAFVGWMMDETEYLAGDATMYISRVMELFTEFKDKHNIKYEANAIQFGVRLHRLKINGITKLKGAKGNKVKFDPVLIREHFGAS